MIHICSLQSFQFPWVTFCLNAGLVQSVVIKERDIALNAAKLSYILNKYLIDEPQPMLKQKEIDLYRNKLLSDKKHFFINAPKGKWHKVGVEKNDLIVDCKIGSNDCYDNFTLYINSDFHNCYTFRHRYEEGRIIGPESGLSVILAGQSMPWFHSYKTMSKSENSKSIKVMIHEKDTLPHPIINPIEVVPGMSTFIALIQKKMERIDTPKSKCSKRTFVESGNRKVIKSFELCINKCYVRYVEDQCGCTILGTKGRYGIQNELTDKKHCLLVDINNLTDTVIRGSCYIEVIDTATKNIKDCLRKCIWNCKETTYDYTLSYSKWPENMVIPSFISEYVTRKPNDLFYKMYHEKLKNIYYNVSKTEVHNDVSVTEVMRQYFEGLTKDQNETVLQKLYESVITPTIMPEHLNLNSYVEAIEKWMQDSFYRVNIYFKQPIVEVHKQILNSNMADLWSGVGGILGLWLGLSAIGAVEILQLITKMIQFIFERLFKTKVKPLNKDRKIIDLV